MEAHSLCEQILLKVHRGELLDQGKAIHDQVIPICQIAQ